MSLGGSTHSQLFIIIANNNETGYFTIQRSLFWSMDLEVLGLGSLSRDRFVAGSLFFFFFSNNWLSIC